MAKVSIIVTAYNIEPYIDQCLASVAAQTLTDIEVLVVDDGSSDETAARITEFAAADRRFTPILLPHNSPGGVATAANVGLDRATSEWVGFVDGDDHIEPTMFESLLAAAECHDTDLAICQYHEVSDDGSERRAPADAKRWNGLEQSHYELDVDSRKRFLRFIAVPWRKLYRRSLLEENRIRFPEVDYFYEDNPFHWFSLVSARSIAVVPRILCYHRVGRAGQTMATADTRLFNIFRHHDTIREWLTKRGIAETYQITLLAWVISQAEWITQRTPKGLRRELFNVLVGIVSQYSTAEVTAALREGRKGVRAQRFCAALVKRDYSRFTRALDGRPDTHNYVRVGLYHLRHSGVKKTLSMTNQTVRNHLGSSALAQLLARRTPYVQSHPTTHSDVMFGLMVIQQRIEGLERKLDELTRVVDELRVAQRAEHHLTPPLGLTTHVNGRQRSEVSADTPVAAARVSD